MVHSTSAAPQVSFPAPIFNRTRPAASPFALTVLCIAIVGIIGIPEPSHALDGPGEAREPLDLLSLNIRLSSKAIRPPGDLVKKVVVLQGIRVARPLTGDPTRAAILEDDTRRRVLVLSAPQDNTDEQILAYVLDDLDLEDRLPQLTACSNRRQCATDRTPGVGGLGCVAFCLVETLRK